MLAVHAHDETIHTTTLHPWFTADHGWLQASWLHLGERVLRADGSTAEVVAIRVVPGAAMWDLTVSELHDFAVGTGQFVVHNCANTVGISKQRVQYVVDNMDRLAPDAVGGTPDLSEKLIKYDTGSYRPDIRTDKALFEVGGPGKYKELQRSITQATRLAQAARFKNLAAYYAWDATEAAMPEALRTVAERWGVRIFEFTM